VAPVPATVLKAIADREATIERLEGELRKREEKPSTKKLPDLPSWVGEQLKDLAGLLKSDPAKVKSEFRRLNLQLTFHPTEAEPRPHYIVKGQCDLSALVFSICAHVTRVRFWTHRGSIRSTAAPQFH
jgi:hypothetical protein